MEFSLKLYEDQKWTDVEFYFDDKDKKISAHKLIISNASEVFEAMCYGDLKEASPIKIVDIEFECFQEMMRFIYTGEAKLNTTNIMGVYYAANKYMIPLLETKCIDFILTSVTAKNVLWYLDKIPETFIESKFKKALEILQNNTKEALQNINISLDTLILILKQTRLAITEKELFEYTMKWATQKCKDTKVNSTPKDLRTVIGEKAIKLLGFPFMDFKEFVMCNDNYLGLLSDMEFREICTDIVKLTNKSEFNHKKIIIKTHCTNCSR